MLLAIHTIRNQFSQMPKHGAEVVFTVQNEEIIFVCVRVKRFEHVFLLKVFFRLYVIVATCYGSTILSVKISDNTSESIYPGSKILYFKKIIYFKICITGLVSQAMVLYSHISSFFCASMFWGCPFICACVLGQRHFQLAYFRLDQLIICKLFSYWTTIH